MRRYFLLLRGRKELVYFVLTGIRGARKQNMNKGRKTVLPASSNLCGMNHPNAQENMFSLLKEAWGAISTEPLLVFDLRVVMKMTSHVAVFLFFFIWTFPRNHIRNLLCSLVSQGAHACEC